MATIARQRNPDRTREALLEAAFDEIYEQGFRAASLDNILRRTGVTKGALYHHFPNKTALGYAVVDEIIFPHASEHWAPLVDCEGNPIDTLLQLIQKEVAGADDHRVTCGCPFNNLVQEMAGIDEGFRERLHHMQAQWRAAISSALTKGQRAGQVREDINAERAATLLVASYEGCVGLAKCGQSKQLFGTCMSAVADYVRSLRPTTK